MKMSYRHIMGDLYEFERQDAPCSGAKITCIRLASVDHFYRHRSTYGDSEYAEHTIVYLRGVAGGLPLCIHYEEFKDLMRMWVENDMLERAQMKRPEYIYQVDGQQIPQIEFTPEKPADCEKDDFEVSSINYPPADMKNVLKILKELKKVEEENEENEAD